MSTQNDITRGDELTSAQLRERAHKYRSYKHGHTAGGIHTKTYATWKSMRRRCNQPKDPDYKYYGARGISVCDRWKKFENFLADMGESPDGMSIDRENNDGNYEPGNCRWATKSEQIRNTRSARFIEVSGEKLTLSESDRKLGLCPGTVRSRLKRGWSIDRIVSTPNLRHRTNAAAGERHGGAKLTLDDVKNIRYRREHQKESIVDLAARYGVSTSTIYRITTGRQWTLARPSGADGEGR